MILNFSKFSMNFYENDEKTAILKAIKISKKCHGRRTKKYCGVPNKQRGVRIIGGGGVGNGSI